MSGTDQGLELQEDKLRKKAETNILVMIPTFPQASTATAVYI
jgi:hypothetical protein